MSDTRTIPESWEWTTLGDIAETSSGGTPRRSRADYFGGSIPWLKIGDLNDGLITTTEETITEAGLAESSATKLPPGTLVIAMYGSIGKLGILGMEATTNQAICAVRPRPGMSRGFLYWFLRSQRDALVTAGFGGTQANISQTFLRKLPVPFPPRAEQDRIVERLRALDERVCDGERSFEEAAHLMERLELAILHAGFSGELTDHHEDWERAKIGDVVDQCLGKMLDKAKNRGEPRPYLRNVNVQWGRFELDDVKQMRIEDSERSRYGVEPGDLLVCEGGEPGRCAVWRSDQEMYFQKALHRVRPGPKLDVDFLQRYLTYAARLRLLDPYFTGTTIKHLPGEKLRDVPVPMPSRSIQQAIIDAIDGWLSVADRLQAELGRHSTQLRALRSGLLHTAISGRLVAQDRADEPASELLARLRDGRVEPDREEEGAAA